MRSAHEALLTIVEVLLYDPLYAWTISPLRAYALQHRRGTMNTTAEDTTMQTEYLDMTAAGPSENCKQFAQIMANICKIFFPKQV